MTTTTTTRPESAGIAWGPVLWIVALHLGALLAFLPAYFTWQALAVGVFLHWFTGDATDTQRAIGAGSFFSVNAAMTLEQIRLLPRDRVLCETDFPARKVRARKPADIERAELLLSKAWGVSPDEVRATTWWNLRTLSEQTGAIERLPEAVADRLLYL